jgi:hypothetical protein
MTQKNRSYAGARAKTRLVNLHKEEYDRLYQEELNRLGMLSREQQFEERYGDNND